MAIEQSAGGPAGPWLPPDGTAVCCVTADQALLEECARAAAVAGVPFEAAPTAEQAEGLWSRSDIVLLGADVHEVPPQRRSSTVLVARGADRAQLWQRAAALGVEHVAELPDAAGWLVEFLGRRRADGPAGAVLGVLGGCGGAGASTAAALLAGACALAGSSTLLVDGDRLAGGLEAALSEHPPSGLHWPDLVGASGQINPGQLSGSVPQLGGLSMLSWPAGAQRAARVPASVVSGVLDAARSAYDLVVVDIGRGRESLEDFAWSSDRLLMVVPGRLGAVLSAAQLIHELPPVPLGAVVRGPFAEGIDAEQISEAVGCPLAARLPRLRGAGAAAEAGTLLSLARLRRVRSFAAQVLEAFPERPDEPAAAPSVGRVRRDGR
ncbi:septum site-determining protein Ssd [Sinomonas halotolerans]|uniref:Septum site-determining protein Ssd n=1 Tax=Sinomonas halotolerans TaxID=1644133 RepID=A0ABU9X3A4_9MICC